MSGLLYSGGSDRGKQRQTDWNFNVSYTAQRGTFNQYVGCLIIPDQQKRVRIEVHLAFCLPKRTSCYQFFFDVVL